MSAEHLSTALFRETRGSGFFRVLSGKNATFYVDVLDALEREASERAEGMAREEVVALVGEVLEHHPGFEFDGELGENPEMQLTGTRDKARLLLEHLLKCHWLEEPPRRDWRRTIHFDAHGATLIAALRKIAWPEAAVFTDKLIAVCGMLADEVEISIRPWQIVENCLSNVRQGLNELWSMQKSVQRFTRRQLEEETLGGNLAVVFDDFSEQMSHACYGELVRSRLPLRLPDAVQRIHIRLMDDAVALVDMQTEVLRRNPGMSAETARAKVHQSLDELVNLVERILPMADEVDRRTADFTRRSLARFRYLQDVTGERRTEVKALFETANRLLAGKRLSIHAGDLPELPALRLPSVKLPAGRDSLYSPPTRRTPLEQEPFEDSTSDADRDEGVRGIERSMGDSLSVQRANKFVQSLPGGKGDRIESRDLSIGGESGLTDLISLLLHSESAEARYRLDIERVAREESAPPMDTLEGFAVERFSIIKK